MALADPVVNFEEDDNFNGGPNMATGKRAGARKQSSNKTSSIAGKVLAGKKPTPKEVKALAASVLSQDEKKG